MGASHARAAIGARTKQAELSQARAERHAERLAAKRRHQAKLDAEERRRLERLYAGARYGDILKCVIEDGIADFQPGWRRYRPAPFTLARGEDKYVSFQGEGRKGGRFWSRYSPDGREVTICYRKGRKARGCATFSAMSRDYQMGIERALTIDNIFRNARLACAYRPGPGMPRTVIHQHNIEVRRVIHIHHHGRRPVAVRRVVEEHHWYALPKARQRRDTRHRARRVEETLDHKPTAESDHERRRAVPPASRRARTVAAPESAVQDDERAERCGDDRTPKRRARGNRRWLGSDCWP